MNDLTVRSVEYLSAAKQPVDDNEHEKEWEYDATYDAAYSVTHWVIFHWNTCDFGIEQDKRVLRQSY